MPGATVRPTPATLLDAASGQPLTAAGRQALLAALDAGWADPARLYRDARQAAVLLDAARESIAAAIGARPPEVSFTSSTTQALHLAVAGALRARAGPVAVSAVEHSAVLRAADEYERAGGEVRIIPVDETGRVDVGAAVGSAAGAALLCLQAANQEVGTTQPVDEVAAGLGEVPILMDATHVTGWADIPPAWDILAAGAPQWGGPPGVGILAVRTGVRWRSPGPADEREGGRVPGTPAVPLIVAAARALESTLAARPATAHRARAWTAAVRTGIEQMIPDAEILGHPEHRVPHVAAASFLYVDGESLVRGLDRRGYAIGSGSACVADTRRPSHVLAAMGALTGGNVRLSLPVEGDPGPPGDLVAALADTVAEVRAELGAPT